MEEETEREEEKREGEKTETERERGRERWYGRENRGKKELLKISWKNTHGEPWDRVLDPHGPPLRIR